MRRDGWELVKELYQALERQSPNE